MEVKLVNPVKEVVAPPLRLSRIQQVPEQPNTQLVTIAPKKLISIDHVENSNISGEALDGSNPLNQLKVIVALKSDYVMNQVPNQTNAKQAKTILRNTHHIAIALRYNKKKSGAPEIMPKGERLCAEARQYNIPIVQNVPLAQALNKLDVGEEIPESLYQAVAEVLTFVYALQQGQQAGSKQRLAQQAPHPSAAAESLATKRGGERGR